VWEVPSRATEQQETLGRHTWLPAPTESDPRFRLSSTADSDREWPREGGAFFGVGSWREVGEASFGLPHTGCPGGLGAELRLR